MNRILALSSTMLLAASAVAQCLPAPTGTSVTPQLLGWSVNYTTTFPVDDEGLTSPPIAFTAFPNFPMAGAIGNLDQMWVNSNGDIYLTDSTLALANVVGGASFGISSLAEMRGTLANATARIAVLGHDQQASIAAGAAWDIKVDQTVPGEVRVSWTDMRRFNNATDKYSFGCTLYGTGAVRMDWTTIPNPNVGNRIVGISRGNAVGSTSSPNQDLTAGVDSGTVGLIYELFSSTRPVDVGNKSIMFTPNGIGGYTTSVLCDIPPASHTTYNNGCYTYGVASEAFYELFTTPALTSAQLPGTSITLTPTANGYAVVNGGGAYVAPTGAATILALTDDSEASVTPSIPFPHVSGLIPTIAVASNGNINMAASPSGNSTTAYGTVASLLGATVASFRSNGDYDPGNSPGKVKAEEAANILFITWEDVERFGVNGTSDRLQFQLNLLSGVVVIVWDAMAASGTGSAAPTCVGYTPGGGSLDGGSIDLATALPIVTQPDISQLPLSLSAAPAPTFVLAGSSVPITYTTSNLQDLSPAIPGVYLAAMAFSINTLPPAPGFDLTFIGLDAPGCDLNVSSIDVYFPINPVSSTHNEVIVVPQPLVPGDTFYVQAVNFFIPNQLPNGQNNAGIITSNGVKSVFQTF